MPDAPYPLWLLPTGSVISAVIRLSLRLDASVITHQPWAVDQRATCWTKESARAARAKQIETRRAQQLAIPETYDDRLGR